MKTTQCPSCQIVVDMAAVQPGSGATCPGCGLALLMAEPPPMPRAAPSGVVTPARPPTASTAVWVIGGVLVFIVIGVSAIKGSESSVNPMTALLAVFAGLACFLFWKVIWAWLMFPIHHAERQERMIALLEQMRRP